MAGICPQHDVLFEFLTVNEHFELLANIKGINEGEMARKISDCIKLVDLDTQVCDTVMS